MSDETKKEIQLEIAHVLFIDIVGYSKLSINEQRADIDELTRIVRATEHFQRAEPACRRIHDVLKILPFFPQRSDRKSPD